MLEYEMDQSGLGSGPMAAYSVQLPTIFLKPDSSL
jgi:hypothetical protein